MIGVLHLIQLLAHPICHNHAILCLIRINYVGDQAVACMDNLSRYRDKSSSPYELYHEATSWSKCTAPICTSVAMTGPDSTVQHCALPKCMQHAEDCGTFVTTCVKFHDNWL